MVVYPEMAFCKCMLDAAHGIEYSTLVTAMARNGTYFGIRVSGLGDEWFTAPAPEVKGFFFRDIHNRMRIWTWETAPLWRPEG